MLQCLGTGSLEYVVSSCATVENHDMLRTKKLLMRACPWDLQYCHGSYCAVYGTERAKAVGRRQSTRGKYHVMISDQVISRLRHWHTPLAHGVTVKTQR